MACQLKHECLAETHHFGVALSAWREVGTSLATTHRQCGERVLECLLECKELKDAEVYALVETDAALVGTDGVVMLYSIAHVGLNLTLIVHPVYAELVNSVGDAEALDEVHLVEFRVFVVLFFNCAKHFFYCLMVFRFVGETHLQCL